MKPRFVFARVVLSALALSALVLGVFFAASPLQARASELKILEIDTMVGVPRSYVASSGNTIRGVSGGGLPWVIGGAKGELSTTGELEILVTGLVFDPNDQAVIDAGLANRNTVAQFRAIVSCQTLSGGFENVMTDPFNATVGTLAQGGGNAKIETMVNLPKPCIAPIVFVTSPRGQWFAVTGN